MKILNSFYADDLALCRAHGAMVAAPKRMPAPVAGRQPVHSMCLAMSEVFQYTPATNADPQRSTGTVTAAQPDVSVGSATGWRMGRDIPKSEQVGLWFYRTNPADLYVALGNACDLGFDCIEYWKAPAGTKPGDKYSEDLYAQHDNIASRIAAT